MDVPTLQFGSILGCSRKLFADKKALKPTMHNTTTGAKAGQTVNNKKRSRKNIKLLNDSIQLMVDVVIQTPPPIL